MFLSVWVAPPVEARKKATKTHTHTIAPPKSFFTTPPLAGCFRRRNCDGKTNILKEALQCRPSPFPSPSHFISISLSVRVVSMLVGWRLEVKFMSQTVIFSSCVDFCTRYRRNNASGIKRKEMCFPLHHHPPPPTDYFPFLPKPNNV